MACGWETLASLTHHKPPTSRRVRLYLRRGATPGPFFFTLGLREPRGSVRFGLGAAFFRAARFSFLRSNLSLVFFVSIVELIADS